MILVTGCAGFIGSHLCQFLLEDRQNIVGVDNFDPFYDIRIKKRNLAILKRYSNFKFHPVDITNIQAVKGLFHLYSIKKIIHLAARPGVSASQKDPLTYAFINIQGTLTLLQQLKDNNKIQFIFGSSSSVYGNSKNIPFQENDATIKPLSPYGISKKSAEVYCRLFHDLYGIKTTVLRFFTVYGPRVRPDMAMVKFIRAIRDGREITLYNDGEIERDYTYVEDIVYGIYQAIKRQFPFEIINLGNNHPIKLKTVIYLLEEKLNQKAKIKNAPLPMGEMVKTWADIRRAKRLLGWTPKISINDGIEKLIVWCKKNN